MEEGVQSRAMMSNCGGSVNVRFAGHIKVSTNVDQCVSGSVDIAFWD